MPLHSVYVFDRKGKTLFTKRYIDPEAEQDDESAALLAEQRKLVFGMLFSLREVVTSLSPNQGNEASGLQSIQTGASILFQHETNSGLRFALYLTDNVAETAQNHNTAASIRKALEQIYIDLWIPCVIRSPLYRPTEPNVKETNFEISLDSFLKKQAWFQ